MNICNLVGVNVMQGSRALTLSRHRLLVLTAAPVHVAWRNAHNGLYQMVKKRTLEARSKVEAKPSPKKDPTQNEFQATSGERSISFQSTKPIRPKLMSQCAVPPQVCKADTPKCTPNTDSEKERCPPKFSQNADILKASNCKKIKPICEIKVIPPDDGGDKSGAGGKGGNTSKTLLIALAAALGIGGALWYLAGSGAGTDQETSPTIDDTTTAVTSSSLPKHVPYILIGGGTASFSAFRAIKSNDAKAKVLMITDENRKPYMRPPLSKELWYSAKDGEISKDYRFKQWTGAERSLYFEPDEFFVDPSRLMQSENGGIAVAQGFKVKKIDPTKRIVTLSDGYEIGYDECLIATGCSPKNLQLFSDAPPGVKEKIMLYRTPEDFEKLKKYIDAKKNVTIVGNGFIGSELACSLANYSKNVSEGGKIVQIFQEAGNMSKVLPDYLSKWTMQKVFSQGVCVMPGCSVKRIYRDESKLKLFLSTGDTVITDVVVVCVGCEANTSIAAGSGLEIDRKLGGFVVNAELEARRNLFVAGDVSCFYDPLLGRRRVEHHDHSVISGRLAGENMVGKKKPYTHQSMFWSDLGPEIGYEGIGLVDSSLPTVGVFALPSKSDRQSDNLTENVEIESSVDTDTPSTSTNLPDVKCNEEDTDNYGRGVVFYLKDEKIVGILLWNIFNRIGLARTVINQNKTYCDLNEVAKLFEIHS